MRYSGAVKMPKLASSSDFDVEHDRRNWRSIKWTGDPNIVVAGSVADLDFAVAEPIVSALRERLAHPFLGYHFQDDRTAIALVRWYDSVHQTMLTPDQLVQCPFGPKASLQLVARALLKPSDVVCALTPTYPGLLQFGAHAACERIEWPMQCLDGRFRLDWATFEQVAGRKSPTVLVLANPGNPTGQVLTKLELEEVLLTFCNRGDLRLIVSDEVHGDLIYPPNDSASFLRIPAAGEYLVVVSSVGKTFNLSGMGTSYVISRNSGYLSQIKRCLASNGFHEGSMLGGVAQLAALTKGTEWRSQLLPYLSDLSIAVIGELTGGNTGLRPLQPDASFLMAVDYSSTNVSEPELRAAFAEAGISVQYGSRFFGAAAKRYFRLNFGAPKRLAIKWAKMIASVSTRVGRGRSIDQGVNS